MKILCVKKSDLVKAPNLQKDNDTINKVFTGMTYIEETEIPEDYVPLDIAITIRSAYTNKVVLCTHDDSTKERCFLNTTKIPEVIHRGYDLIMFISSIAVMKMCDQTRANEVGSVMMHSKFDFLGMLNLDHDIVNPILYSHVILEDCTVEAFEPLLSTGFRMIPISELPEHGNFKAFKESLIICNITAVEGGKKDEQCDFN